MMLYVGLSSSLCTNTFDLHLEKKIKMAILIMIMQLIGNLNVLHLYIKWTIITFHIFWTLLNLFAWYDQKWHLISKIWSFILDIPVISFPSLFEYIYILKFKLFQSTVSLSINIYCWRWSSCRFFKAITCVRCWLSRYSSKRFTDKYFKFSPFWCKISTEKQEAHGPHRSPEKTVQIIKRIW